MRKLRRVVSKKTGLIGYRGRFSIGGQRFQHTVWDAFRSDRAYRPAWTREKTLQNMKALSGTHFDPEILDVFMKSEEEPKPRCVCFSTAFITVATYAASTSLISFSCAG